jgi:hypothetical protein
LDNFWTRTRFIAQLDMGLGGCHVVECPHCGHGHCRTIKAGVVTGERWDSREQRVDVDARRVWKAHSQPIVTSTAAAFIRQLCLNRVAAGTTNRFWFAETASRDGLATPRFLQRFLLPRREPLVQGIVTSLSKDSSTGEFARIDWEGDSSLEDLHMNLFVLRTWLQAKFGKEEEGASIGASPSRQP